MPKYGTFSATTCGFLKMPEPMTQPTTTAVAMSGPRARTRRDGEPVVSVAFMGHSVRPLLAAGKQLMKRTASGGSPTRERGNWIPLAHASGSGIQLNLAARGADLVCIINLSTDGTPHSP